jgi:hypothetical protein
VDGRHLLIGHELSLSNGSRLFPRRRRSPRTT